MSTVLFEKMADKPYYFVAFIEEFTNLVALTSIFVQGD